MLLPSPPPAHSPIFSKAAAFSSWATPRPHTWATHVDLLEPSVGRLLLARQRASRGAAAAPRAPARACDHIQQFGFTVGVFKAAGASGPLHAPINDPSHIPI